MDQKDVQKRLRAAWELLELKSTTSREKFESMRALIKDINPKLDALLDACSRQLSNYEKLRQGEVVELTIENLPENTAEEKERKKALLLLVKTWKELANEVERVKTEFENIEKQKSPQGNAEGVAKIIAYAKGPFGVITLVAVVIVGVLTFMSSSQEKRKAVVQEQKPGQVLSETSNDNLNKIKVIIVEGKKIPLSETRVASGADCDSEHYHALNHTSASALDGSTVTDPGGCGYGKVRDTRILEFTP